jgi:S-adenosylmethionine uptake transporter
MQSLWMLVAALLFSLMGVFIKLGSEFYNTGEIVFYRSLFTVICMAFLLKVRHVSLATIHWKEHTIRSLVGAAAFSLWFFTIIHLPLATAMTLNYTAPLFVALFLAFGWFGLQKTPVDKWLYLAIALGFAGVVVLMQPSVAAGQWWLDVLCLISAVLAATALSHVRILGKLGEPGSRIIFYFSLAGTIVGALLALVSGGFHSHTLRGGLYLFGVGATATVAQMAITRAYGKGHPLLTACLQFSGVIFSTGFGIWLWGDLITFNMVLGMSMVVVAGMLATWLTARAERLNIVVAERSATMGNE